MLSLLLLSLACQKQPPVAAAVAPSCERPGGVFGPVVLPDGQPRYGEGVTSLDGLSVSKARPVEACAVNGLLAWLTSARCADGSAPFANADIAHSARVGSVGQGGQCGSIIDLYTVRCPEAVYEVHMDLYMCRDGEGL